MFALIWERSTVRGNPSKSFNFPGRYFTVFSRNDHNQSQFTFEFCFTQNDLCQTLGEGNVSFSPIIVIANDSIVSSFNSGSPFPMRIKRWFSKSASNLRNTDSATVSSLKRINTAMLSISPYSSRYGISSGSTVKRKRFLWIDFQSISNGIKRRNLTINKTRTFLTDFVTGKRATLLDRTELENAVSNERSTSAGFWIGWFDKLWLCWKEITENSNILNLFTKPIPSFH